MNLGGLRGRSEWGNQNILYEILKKLAKYFLKEINATASQANCQNITIYRDTHLLSLSPFGVGTLCRQMLSWASSSITLQRILFGTGLSVDFRHTNWLNCMTRQYQSSLAPTSAAPREIMGTGHNTCLLFHMDAKGELHS